MKKNITRKYQSPKKIIDVAKWPADDEFSPYPKGARAKSALFCPDNKKYPFLIKDHRYLFKHSFKRYPEQYWVEIIAYIIGCFTNIPVPPAFAAFDSNNNESCALIEWFYGDGPDSKGVHTFFIENGDYFSDFIQDYDRKTGEQHNFKTFVNFAEILCKKKYFKLDWIVDFAKIMLFDSLIGNTDRHQDNWGILWHGGFSPVRKKPRLVEATLSPAYDNGTAMGHEIIEKNFSKFDNITFLERYVQRGTHHIKWDLSDSHRQNHSNFILLLLDTYPNLNEKISGALSFDFNELEEQIMELTRFATPVPLSEERAKFIIKLTKYRYEKLQAILAS